MAHHIYTTDAFILDSTVSGEADRFFTLFTKDLGLVRALAKGVRLQKSKLRYNLQDFSLSKVSLVRGKDIWRLTNARLDESLYDKFRNEKAVLHVIAHIGALIRRLVGGEEKNERLFTILHDSFLFLPTREWGEELKMFEIIVVLKILENLGYLRKTTELEPFIKGEWKETLLQQMSPHKALALREINMSLRESQL